MADEHVVQLLDTNTANQIAAGEVVEKPASVVKELVENALDAGATKIEVTTFAGGTEYIRVVDNGCGMNEANAKMAVLRHATSKLTSADDLLRLHTLGFRGEALPSIASVSNFTLLTRPQEEEFATSVHIDGGEQTEVSSTGAAAGTTVIVENLFFNVPARRKFLKTVATEGRYISELLTKLALSRPDVRFKLTNNDKEVLSTPGDGDLARTIRALYGKNVAENLLTVKLDDPTVQISGFIGRPTLLKGTRGWQTFFVNGRSIGSKMLSKAMDHAYQSQIPKSGFPFAVINITVDTASVDVNVHPQKSEIKFSDDGLIYRAMFKALTDALTRPMSAQKTQVQLLPDSELNAFVPASPKTTLAVHREQPVRHEQPAPCAKADERLQRDSAALFRHNQGVLKEAEQPDAPSVEERLQAALDFGADAVYLSRKAFGMRAAAPNFTAEQLKEAVALAHAKGVKVYLTCNTLPRNDSLPDFPQYVEEAVAANVDAMIVADLGLLRLLRLVLSTMKRARCSMNWGYAVLCWHESCLYRKLPIFGHIFQMIWNWKCSCTVRCACPFPVAV